MSGVVRNPAPVGWTRWLPMAIAVTLFLAWSLLTGGPAAAGRNDFIVFYLGGKLAAVGQLYDIPAMYKAQQALTGGVLEGCPFTRPPFYGGFFRIFAQMPFGWSYVAWLGLNIAALVGFVRVLEKRSPWLACVAGTMLPILLAIGNGQDLPILLLLFALALRDLFEGNDFRAGLWLSLCSIKAHLFLFVPFALLRHKKWKTLAGGLVGGVALVLISFPLAGNWIQPWMDTLRRSDIHQHIELMGNLSALAHAWGLPSAVVGMLSLAVVVAVGYLIWRLPNWELGVAVAIPAAMLVSPHTYMHDFSLYVPVSVLLAGSAESRWLKWTVQLLLWPLPYLIVLAGEPWNAVLPLLLLSLLAAMVSKLAWRQSTGSFQSDDAVQLGNGAV